MTHERSRIVLNEDALSLEADNRPYFNQGCSVRRVTQQWLCLVLLALSACCRVEPQGEPPPRDFFLQATPDAPVVHLRIPAYYISDLVGWWEPHMPKQVPAKTQTEEPLFATWPGLEGKTPKNRPLLSNLIVNPVVAGPQATNNQPPFQTTAVVSAINSLDRAFSGQGGDLDRVSATVTGLMPNEASAGRLSAAANDSIFFNRWRA